MKRILMAFTAIAGLAAGPAVSFVVLFFAGLGGKDEDFIPAIVTAVVVSTATIAGGILLLQELFAKKV